MTHRLYPHWKEIVVYSPAGPQPQVLFETEQFKVVVAGLEPGQRLPPHPEAAAMYHFLEGTGWMIVDDERLAVGPGATVTMPDGAKRGLEAETRLTFVAARAARAP